MYDHYTLGKIALKCQSMGITKYPQIVQQSMNDLFHDFEFICAYIKDILILTKRILEI